MAENLQNLIDRIQKDGVDKAQAEAERIVAAAREKAAQTVREAEEKARQVLAKADQDAQVFAERGEKALEQAARDAILAVQDAVYQTLQALIEKKVGEALTIATLQQMLVKVVEAYCLREGEGERVDLLVSPQDQAQLASFFLQHYRQAIERGAQIHGDGSVIKGFRVSIADENVHHDFTQKEIAAALGRLLRPRLAALVRKAAEAPGTPA
jgi:V/A-type H+-transporting ATPase subunit E